MKWFSCQLLINYACITDDAREVVWSEREAHRLEQEATELRSQLAKTAAAISECGQMRQELDRSEQQRTQLSDHIQVRGGVGRAVGASQRENEGESIGVRSGN